MVRLRIQRFLDERGSSITELAQLIGIEENVGSLGTPVDAATSSV